MCICLLQPHPRILWAGIRVKGQEMMWLPEAWGPGRNQDLRKQQVCHLRQMRSDQSCQRWSPERPTCNHVRARKGMSFHVRARKGMSLQCSVAHNTISPSSDDHLYCTTRQCSHSETLTNCRMGRTKGGGDQEFHRSPI